MTDRYLDRRDTIDEVFVVRPLASDDFLPAWQRADEWFGQTVHEPIHPVFFHHFGGYAVDHPDDGLVGFLIGFRSFRDRDVAFAHVVAIHPEYRGRGIARALYERFERQAKQWGCVWVEGVVHPANEAALAFHDRLGYFRDLVEDWAGPGNPRWVVRKRIQPLVV